MTGPSTDGNGERLREPQLVLAAFWSNRPGVADEVVQAIRDVALPKTGAVVTITRQEVEKGGWDQLRRDLAVFQLDEAAKPLEPPDAQ
jgi:hypothetical protein